VSASAITTPRASARTSSQTFWTFGRREGFAHPDLLLDFAVACGYGREEVERADMGLAREWREATRWAFRESLKAGFLVAEFCRSIRGQQGPGAYLLQQGTVSEFIPEV